MKLDDSMPPLWNIDQFLSKHANDFIREEIANEMDPNLILMRLGKLESEPTMLSSVQNGDTFFVNFNGKEFSQNSEAKNYSF